MRYVGTFLLVIVLTGCARFGPRRECRHGSDTVSAPAAMALVGRRAPLFLADCVLPDNTLERVSLSGLMGKSRYLLLVFYPGDFTFVCPTELLKLDEELAEFAKRECMVVAISVDSQYCHLAWKLASDEEGGIGNLRYPLLADTSHEISRSYGVLSEGHVALRAWFLIDSELKVRHQLVNDLSHGRNVSEALRVIDAVRFTDTHHGLCPVNWEPGDEVIPVPTRNGLLDFLQTRRK